MKICVLGAGVIGLTTAWCLAEAGHDVIIVDRHASTAKDASARLAADMIDRKPLAGEAGAFALRRAA